MELIFKASDLRVETNGRNSFTVTVDADGADIASQLSDPDRLDEMDVDVVRKWLLENDDHDKILEAIGIDKVAKHLSHYD